MGDTDETKCTGCGLRNYRGDHSSGERVTLAAAGTLCFAADEKAHGGTHAWPELDCLRRQAADRDRLTAKVDSLYRELGDLHVRFDQYAAEVENQRDTARAEVATLRERLAEAERELLCAKSEKNIAEGRYEGAQIAAKAHLDWCTSPNRAALSSPPTPSPLVEENRRLRGALGLARPIVEAAAPVPAVLREIDAALSQPASGEREEATLCGDEFHGNRCNEPAGHGGDHWQGKGLHPSQRAVWGRRSNESLTAADLARFGDALALVGAAATGRSRDLSHDHRHYQLEAGENGPRVVGAWCRCCGGTGTPDQMNDPGYCSACRPHAPSSGRCPAWCRQRAESPTQPSGDVRATKEP
jgi:hypothetical protein